MIVVKQTFYCSGFFQLTNNVLNMVYKYSIHLTRKHPLLRYPPSSARVSNIFVPALKQSNFGNIAMIASNLSLISESCKNGVHAQMCLQDFFCSTRCQALSVFPFFEILSSCFRHQIQRFLSKIVPTDARVHLRVPDFTAS